MNETYRRYLAELDDVLLNGSPRTLRKFMKRHGMKLPSSDEVLRVTFHKAITSAKTLPLQYRRQSKQWLEAHHYHSPDDGDLWTVSRIAIGTISVLRLPSQRT
jgi:hypothetical protein